MRGMLIPLFGLGLLCGCQTNALAPMKRSLSRTSWGYQVIADPTGLAPSPRVERFEVRPGDCGANDGWNDCTSDRERSELSSAVIAGETWVHWSIYLPSDYPIIYPVKTALGQFHQKSGHVIWMFQNVDGGYTVDNQTSGRTIQKKRILSDADMRGRWTDVLVHAKWTPASDGFFDVFVNGETTPRYSWRGATQSAGKDVYFKYGVYRSFMSRRPGDEPTQIVYYADVAASDVCATVAKRFDCAAIGGAR